MLLPSIAQAALNPSDWKFTQDVLLTNSGLTEIELPVDTLDAARFGLEDLRLLDASNKEVPFAVERSLRMSRVPRDPQSFQSTATPTGTIITVETGVSQPIEGVTLVSPAAAFKKIVQLEASTNGAQWQILTNGQLVFRQADGASKLNLPIPSALWPFLRMTIDDRRTEPVPFSGAQLQVSSTEPPTEPLPVAIDDRTESPGETHLLLEFPGAHLLVANLEIETPDPLFTRPVAVATQQLSENTTNEAVVASGVIYRLGADDHATASNLTITVETRIPSRQLVLRIRNQDSQPLRITRVNAQRRPVKLVFLVSEPGVLHLVTGNRFATTPRYDLAGVADRLQGARLHPSRITPLASNPAYREPELLPALPAASAELDVKRWPYRKPVLVSAPGVQQLELDLEVLSSAQPSFSDLRVVQAGKQIPYILEHVAATRALIPQAAAATDPKKPTQSRWTLTLPYPSLPVTRLVCTSTSPLFQRQVFLSEQAPDGRGDTAQRFLGQASWVRAPGKDTTELSLALASRPVARTLQLDTENGDNPPVSLAGFQFDYPVARLLFKVNTTADLFMYYGNKDADYPRYDLALISRELQAAQHYAATLGSQEALKRSPWTPDASEPGTTRAVFWVVLAAVIGGLLLVIARLLPSPAQTSDGKAGPRQDHSQRK
jgi:hypothetical protein